MPQTEHLYFLLLSGFFLRTCVLIFNEPCVGEALLGLSSVVAPGAVLAGVSYFASLSVSSGMVALWSGCGMGLSLSCFSSSSVCISSAMAVSTFS